MLEAGERYAKAERRDNGESTAPRDAVAQPPNAFGDQDASVVSDRSAAALIVLGQDGRSS